MRIEVGMKKRDKKNPRVSRKRVKKIDLAKEVESLKQQVRILSMAIKEK